MFTKRKSKSKSYHKKDFNDRMLDAAESAEAYRKMGYVISDIDVWNVLEEKRNEILAENDEQ